MGAFALSCAELEQELHVMTRGVEKIEDRSSSKDELANNEEPLEDDLCKLANDMEVVSELA